MYRLAGEHQGRVGITGTVNVTFFPDDLDAHVVIASEFAVAEQVVDASGDHRRIAYACPGIKKDRYSGVPRDQISEIHGAAGFDVTFVKADGSRMRWLKAPRADEPVLAPGCTTVIALMSARALGEPLTERIAHRLEHVEAVTGATYGEPFKPHHAARLITGPEGLFRGIRDITAVPVINMVDDTKSEKMAREVAEIALGSTRLFDRVILTSMRQAGDPVVAVVER